MLEGDRHAAILGLLQALRVGELFEAAGLGLARDMGVEDGVEPPRAGNGDAGQRVGRRVGVVGQASAPQNLLPVVLAEDVAAEGRRLERLVDELIEEVIHLGPGDDRAQEGAGCQRVGAVFGLQLQEARAADLPCQAVDGVGLQVGTAARGESNVKVAVGGGDRLRGLRCSGCGSAEDHEGAEMQGDVLPDHDRSPRRLGPRMTRPMRALRLAGSHAGRDGVKRLTDASNRMPLCSRLRCRRSMRLAGVEPARRMVRGSAPPDHPRQPRRDLRHPRDHQRPQEDRQQRREHRHRHLADRFGEHRRGEEDVHAGRWA